MAATIGHSAREPPNSANGSRPGRQRRGGHQDFSSPELGLARTYLPNGTTVPLIDYTVRYLSDTQYNVDVVFGQYDLWGDPPDRPWNLPAVVNSVFGIAYQHNTAALRSMADAVQVSSMTMPLGGTVTTY